MSRLRIGAEVRRPVALAYCLVHLDRHDVIVAAGGIAVVQEFEAHPIGDPGVLCVCPRPAQLFGQA
ncbi:MAG: hypothetical protein U1E63_02045 [Burkholderiales bacterium]